MYLNVAGRLLVYVIVFKTFKQIKKTKQKRNTADCYVGYRVELSENIVHAD